MKQGCVSKKKMNKFQISIPSMKISNYILIDWKKSTTLLHSGKDISEVKRKERTLKTFTSRAEAGLWFAWAFGLEIKSMKVSEIKTCLMHTIDVESEESDVTSKSNGFDAPSDEDKPKVDMVLFLLDKFCAGDSFYHEITMLFDDSPRSYFVKQKRNQSNDMYHITSTPGIEEAAQVSTYLLS